MAAGARPSRPWVVPSCPSTHLGRDIRGSRAQGARPIAHPGPHGSPWGILPPLQLQTWTNSPGDRTAGGETEAQSRGGCSIPPTAGAGCRSRKPLRGVTAEIPVRRGCPCAPASRQDRSGRGSPRVTAGTPRDSLRWVGGVPEPPHPCGQSGTVPCVGRQGWGDTSGGAKGTRVPPWPLWSRPRSPGARCQQLPRPRRQGRIIIAAQMLKIAPRRRPCYF